MVVPRLLSLSRIQYLVHPQIVGRISSPLAVKEIVPAVLISKDGLTASNYTKLWEEFATKDDVFTQDFASHVIVQSESASVSEVEVKGFKLKGHSQAVGTDLAEGPYFVQGDEIHQAWRLYPDTLGAFVIATIPDAVTDPLSFTSLSALSDDGVDKAVAVPSRLYSLPTPDKPLSGLRVSIKDSIDLNGVKTTLMNRAYKELYPPQSSTAPFIQDLIAKGAVIVGKTKLCSFASAEEPTDQWIDYMCPINPRGDQYQSPSGSTSGGAASLAGYEWLDFSIGTDTTGSIRAPASCNGLFALRASHGSANLDRIATRCAAFDTIGFLGRDINTFKSFVANSLAQHDFQKFPARLFYPVDFFPHGNENQQTMVMEFMEIIEDFMGVKATKINIAERWMQCPPSEANGKSVKEFLAKSAFWPMYYDLYHATDDFRTDYRKQYGKEPYIGPYVRWSWETAKGVTLADKERGLKEMDVFRKWFQDNVFGPNADTASEAVMLMPNGRAVPKYRDDHNGPPGPVGSYTENYIAAILELPQLIVPVGQNAYQSRNSGRLEHRPIVSSLVGAKGSDLMLINLVKGALEKARWPTSIATGRYMFPLGDNARNVAFTETKSRI